MEPQKSAVDVVIHGEKLERLSPSKMDSSFSFGKWLESGNHVENSRQAGAITLDPVSIISLLALGAFLINNILQLLRTNQLMNQPGARSYGGYNRNVPLFVEDDIQRSTLEQTRIRNIDTTRSEIGSLLADLGTIAFVSSRQRSACLQKVLLCSKDKNSGQQHFKLLQSIRSFATKLLTPEIHARDNSVNSCQILNRVCDDKILEMAKTTSKNKFYEILTSYAVRRLING